MSSYSYSGVTYLGGMPSYPTRTKCKVTISETGIALSRWSKCRAFIRIEDIDEVQVVRFLDLYPPTTTSKSVTGRALVGGLLLGPLGAVVGGLSGVGQKQELTFDQSLHKSDFVLLVEGRDHGLRFRCGFIFPALLLKHTAAQKPLEQIQKMRLQMAMQATGSGYASETDADEQLADTPSYVRQAELRSMRTSTSSGCAHRIGLLLLIILLAILCAFIASALFPHLR